MINKRFRNNSPYTLPPADPGYAQKIVPTPYPTPPTVPSVEPGYAQKLTSYPDEGKARLPRFGSPDFYRAYFPKPINAVNSVLKHPFVRKMNEGALNVRDWATDNGYLK